MDEEKIKKRICEYRIRQETGQNNAREGERE